MKTPALSYIAWAKAMPAAAVNLARSGIDYCPPSLLRLRASDLVTQLPVHYGYGPLRDVIAARYGVPFDGVFTVSGGTSLANWVACAAALDGCPPGTEVIVERPTYEPLLQIPRMLGHRVRRLERRFADDFAIDLDRFRRLASRRTRLAIVTNLHNPSGARIDAGTLAEMARIMGRVGGMLLVDEVYFECLFGERTFSCVHAGSNVIATNSLTKAYGLDGLRAGWMLGPRAIIRRAMLIHDMLGSNGVAPGEQLTLRAFEQLGAIRARAQGLLVPNLARVRRFFAREQRLRGFMPEGGNVVFPRLPAGVGSDGLAAHLIREYSTLVVPGRFFESPRHIRFSFGTSGARLTRGLRNLTRALDDLSEPESRSGGVSHDLAKPVPTSVSRS
jgi:aspartate/methionine/tyrosine aminotransferase